MLAAAPAGAPAKRQELEGIDVIQVGAGYQDYMAATKLSYGRRLGGFVRFAAAATRAARRVERPDVIYATSPPLTMALPAIAASRRHRAPFVFEVRDLWPEAPIQMGALTNPLAVRAARALERFVYRRAAHVVALSPGMREGVIAAGKAPDEVTLIPNASDLELFSPKVDGAPARKRLGLGERFVCTYFGTMGEANDLTQVIDAAAVLRDRGEDGVTFVLHGDGKRRAGLEELARGLENVVFSDPIPDKHAVAEIAAASDACMTIYKDVPILYTCSPNKLFDTFAAGRAAIVNTPGWLTELVEENEAGCCCAAGRRRRPGGQGDPPARRTPSWCGSYGENARRLAETRVRPRHAGDPAGGVESRCDADAPLLLRRKHQRPRAPARLSRRHRAHAPGGGGVRGAGARQRLGRRLRGCRARARGRDAPDRTRAADRQGRERLDAAARGARPLLPAAERGLRAQAGSGAGPGQRAGGRPARRGGHRAAPGKRRHAQGLRLAAARGGAGAGRCALACRDHWWSRAGAMRSARWAGPSPARSWCGARRPSRWASSTRTSSSTRTRPTSASACATPAGGSSTRPRRGRSTTTSSAPTRRACAAASWSSTAAATSTCASTARRPARLAARLLWTIAYAERALAALVLPRHDPRRYWMHAAQELRPGRGEGIREAAEAYNRETAASRAASPPGL